MRACIHTFMRAHIVTYTHTKCMHAYRELVAYTHTHTRAPACMHACMHGAYIHTYMHIHHSRVRTHVKSLYPVPSLRCRYTIAESVNLCIATKIDMPLGRETGRWVGPAGRQTDKGDKYG